MNALPTTDFRTTEMGVRNPPYWSRRRGSLEPNRSFVLEASTTLLRTLAGVLDIRSVFARISHIIEPLVPHDGLALNVSDRAGRVTLEARSSRDLPHHGWGAVPEHEAFAIVVGLGGFRARCTDDEPSQLDPLVAAGYRSMISICGVAQHHIILTFFSKKVNAYTLDDVPAARHVADCIAVSVAHEHLAAAELDRAEERARFERKRAEDARTRAETELHQVRTALARRQRVSLLGEVAASLVHEIRQPIAAALIDTGVCLRALGHDRFDVQTAREAASRMARDATWADEIINRTTALYKKDTTEREHVNVNTVIRDTALLLQREASASSIAIRTELAAGIPDVIADRVQLQQVLMNLMLNAIEAMKDSGGDLTVASRMTEDGELSIAVRDAGVGLPTENPDQIFESFVTTKPHGTGMGLAIARAIVESHGGRLWAERNTGAGATFRFTLPGDGGH